MEIPALEFWNPSEEEVLKKGLRNQHLKVLPACKLQVRGSYRVLVEPNPALSEFGTAQAMYFIPPGTGDVTPSFYVSLRKDLDLKDIEWAIRLYLVP